MILISDEEMGISTVCSAGGNGNTSVVGHGASRVDDVDQSGVGPTDCGTLCVSASAMSLQSEVDLTGRHHECL